MTPFAALAPVTRSSTPTPSPSTAEQQLEDGREVLAEWLDRLPSAALTLGVVLVVLVVLWFVGRALIRGVTLGIERGAPLQDARTRRALSKAKIPIAQPDTVEMRLEAERRRKRARTLQRVLESALAVVLIAIALTTVLTTLGVPVGPMLASAGVVGVALGFGAQSLVKDVLSGMFMLIEDQYGVGDVVDLGEATGSVEEVGLRSTRLRSLDGTVWYIPNGEIRRVGNMTRMWSRAVVEARLAYDTDVEAARQAMIDAVEAAKAGSEMVASNVLSEPDVAGIESLEFNAVMLRLLVQVNPATQWDIMREIRREMRRIFDERGIELAVPGEAMVVDTPPRRPRAHEGHDAPQGGDE